MLRKYVLLLLVLILHTQVAADVVIDIEAAPSGLEANIQARTALQSEPCDAPAWRIRRLFARVEKDIDPALRAFGFYQVKFQKRLEQKESCWQVLLRIDPGPRVSVRKRSVTIVGEATEDKELASLLAKLPLAEGDPLNHSDYETIKSRLREFAVERGYLDFVFTRQQLRVYPKESAAEIAIEASSGPRFLFGELRFDKQPLSDDFIRRLSRLESGQPYDARKLATLDRNLSDTGYFKNVEVRARREQREGRMVPVDVSLDAASQHAWKSGVGFATDTGARLSLGYENRYLNEEGHRFEGEIRLSPVESGVSAEYRIPGNDPHKESFSFGAQAKHEDTETSIGNSLTLSARHAMQWHGWTQTRFIEFLHEQSEVGGNETNATLLMPGITLNRTVADNVLRTRHGYRINLEARAAYEGLLSTTSLLQLRADVKGIHRFGEGGRLTARTSFANTLGDSTASLPASLRYFAGGDNSVRGYAYKSLGPVDSTGAAIGARNLLTASAEYEHPVMSDDWWVAAFVDGGNAFDIDDLKFKVGYGVGVRWYSPIGRLRLDLAFPDDTTQDSWRLHFGLGADL